ncbi:N-6 DNA methylase [Kitasatospora phosalacinea]|uniref:N-6 DNA methylase n=1 Tax=Kitasatospora phosalacinea TaxID=2065 RepID=UPI0035E0F5CF
MPDRPEVTAAEIARLAGVGRAAVSNWRRRHPDFPKPAGGTEASPTFRLDQVEQWLRDQGKLAELPLLERVWRQLETLRDPAGPAAAPLVTAGAVLLLLHRDPAARTDLAEQPDTRLATALPKALRRTATATLGPDAPTTLDLPLIAGATHLDLARLLARLTTDTDPATAYEHLLTRHAEANPRLQPPLPTDTAALLAALAEPGPVPAASAESGAAPAVPGPAPAAFAEHGRAPAALAESGSAPAALAEPGAAPAEPGRVPAASAEAGSASAALAGPGSVPADSAESGLAPAAFAEPGRAPAALAEPGSTPADSAESGRAPAAVAEPGAASAVPGRVPAVLAESGPVPAASGESGRASVALAEPGPVSADPAGVGRVLLDPACGTGGLLLAADAVGGRLGQEADPALAGVALLRLALAAPADAPGPLPLDVRPGDALRADAFPGRTADAVLCRPPYNERDWGHDQLQYDSRWPGRLVPPRGESELAWVLHCLAHTRPGGTAVLLLPPTVASRRAGRRVRAELVRSGALRAVAALPAGAAPPYGVPLHVWVLRGPEPGDEFRHVLLLDAAADGGTDRAALHDTVLTAWREFDAAARTGAPLPADRPGRARAVPALDLLDDETDLTPARHLPAAPAGAAPDLLAGLRERLGAELARLADLDTALPAVTAAADPAPPQVSIGELARSGALQVHSSGQGAPARPGGRTPLITDQDLQTGAPPGAATDADQDTLTVRHGDVLVPVLGGEGARAVHPGSPYAGAALGPRLHLLRPDPELLDPDFLAGQLRATGAGRRASSYASTTSRLDIRRVELPRVPIARQRLLGAAFRRIAAYETALAAAAAEARTLTRALTDGLASGATGPA